MYTKLFYPLLFTLILFLNACGSNSQTDNAQNFSLEEKKFVHKLFLTEYFWYDQVASNVDYAALTTPQGMINTLKVTPPDKWSFTMTAQEYDDYVNQKTVGFGFGYTPDFTIYLVRIDAPAYNKLLRGDKILQVDGQPVSQALITQAKQNIQTPTTFTVLRDDTQTNIVISPSEYTFKVTLGKVIEHQSKKIGYLRYDSFSGSSVPEFEAEFTKFKEANISELIIDLRYNGGGSIAVASALLDNISNAQPGARQVYLDWNANQQNRNENFSFDDEVEPNDLNMSRVLFLVTQNSASASELVISALKPYLGEENVITIGTQTHGKPVGMSGKVYANNYYFLINFFVRNNLGKTTSLEGIPATCNADDDITHIMGDKDENMLATALYYIDTNTCP